MALKCVPGTTEETVARDETHKIESDCDLESVLRTMDNGLGIKNGLRYKTRTALRTGHIIGTQV